MALQTSGAISISNIATEFGGLSYPPVELDDYYSADPLRITNYSPSAGQPFAGADLGMDEFYGSSVRTTRIYTRPNNDSFLRYGYARANGYFYYQAESGQSGSAFGGSTRTSSLALSGRTLACFVMNDTFYDSLTVGFSGGSSSTNGGWTGFRVYDTLGSPYKADFSSVRTVYRSQAVSFSALPGTSPTVYAYRWDHGTTVAGSNQWAFVAQMLKNNAGSTPNWVYVEFF